MTPMLTTGYLIVIYLIGAYLTAMTIGFLRSNIMNGDIGFAFLLICLWPLTLILIGVINIGDAIEDWANENPSTAHCIYSIFDRITIPFRPISLGKKIREWLDNRKGGAE